MGILSSYMENITSCCKLLVLVQTQAILRDLLESTLVDERQIDLTLAVVQLLVVLRPSMSI